MTLRIPLIKYYLKIISAFAPTLTSDDATNSSFYVALSAVLRSLPPHDKIVLLGDFNARVGCVYHIRSGVIGRQGVGNPSDNGLCLPVLNFI